jgi:hypothetical protein
MKHAADSEGGRARTIEVPMPTPATSRHEAFAQALACGSQGDLLRIKDGF